MQGVSSFELSQKDSRASCLLEAQRMLTGRGEVIQERECSPKSVCF